MATERDTYIVDTAEANKALEKLRAKLREVKEEVDTGMPSFQKMASEWKENITSSFLTASAQFELAKRALEGLGEIVKEGIHGYVEQAIQLNRMGVVLKNVGADSEKWTKKLHEQAEALEGTIGANSEATLSIQTMLLTMGLAPKEIERVTEAAYRLAQTMDVDAKTAARMLARAHEDGREELKKYGITLSDTAAQGHGFSGILKEIEKQTNDINKNMPEYVELTNAQGHAWDDLKKSIGGAAAELWVFLNQDELKMRRLMKVQTDAVKAAVELGDKIKEENLNKYGHIKDVGVGQITMTEETKEEAAAREKTEKAFVEALHRRQEAIQVANREERELRDEQEKSEQEFNARGFESYDQMQKNRVESAKQAQADLTALSDIEIQNEEEKYRVMMEAANTAANEKEELANREAEKLQEIQDNMLSEIKEYGRQLVSFFTSMYTESLTENTRFNASMRELSIERKLVGMDEQTAAQKRLEIEKQMAAEEKAAFQKRLAAFLAHISGQAAGKAIFEAADAIASAAAGNYGAAALHAAAALAFGAIAGVTGGSAAAISAGRGFTAEERQQLDDARSASAERDAREKKQAAMTVTEGPGTIVNVYNIGIAGATELEQAQELERIRKQFEDTKTGGGGGR